MPATLWCRFLHHASICHSSCAVTRHASLLSMTAIGTSEPQWLQCASHTWTDGAENLLTVSTGGRINGRSIWLPHAKQNGWRFRAASASSLVVGTLSHWLCMACWIVMRYPFPLAFPMAWHRARTKSRVVVLPCSTPPNTPPSIERE